MTKGFNDYKSAVKSCIPLSNEFVNDLMEYSDEILLPVPVVRSSQKYMELQIHKWFLLHILEHKTPNIHNL